VKQKRSLATDIEYYSMHRAERSIRRADVVLHFFDPRLRISRVDKQLAEYVLENHKPAAFVVNKWDLARDTIPTDKWVDYLRQVFPMLDHMPIAFVTAKSGKNVYRLLNLAQQLHKQAGRRIKTGELNRVFKEAMTRQTPPVRQGRVAKVYYAAQVGTHPPTIVVATNGPELFDDTYQRYRVKCVRDQSPFAESPIKLVLRTKGEMAGGGADTDPEEPLPPHPPGADELDLSAEVAEPAKPRRKKKPKGPGTWEL
jgi:GTP-binding protein